MLFFNYPVRYLERFDGPLQNGAQPRRGRGTERRMGWRPLRRYE